MTSSAVIWGLGDLTAQSLEDRDRRGSVHSTGTAHVPLDWKRAGTQAGYAAVVWTPIAASWYKSLDLMALRVASSGSLAFVGFKVGLEVTLLHPIALALFFGSMGVARGDSFGVVISKFEREFIPTLAFEVGLWTPLDVALFSLVPVRYQLIVVNSGSVFMVMFPLLSFIRFPFLQDASSKVLLFHG